MLDQLVNFNFIVIDYWNKIAIKWINCRMSIIDWDFSWIYIRIK